VKSNEAIPEVPEGYIEIGFAFNDDKQEYYIWYIEGL
jgi:hypothetical protein